MLRKARYLRALGDDAIASSSPISPACDASDDCACLHRDALCSLVLVAGWRNPNESSRHIEWRRELWQTLAPYGTGKRMSGNLRTDKFRSRRCAGT
jgi:hypothetical protein